METFKCRHVGGGAARRSARVLADSRPCHRGEHDTAIHEQHDEREVRIMVLVLSPNSAQYVKSRVRTPSSSVSNVTSVTYEKEMMLLSPSSAQHVTPRVNTPPPSASNVTSVSY